jgi:hypothetical protein
MRDVLSAGGKVYAGQPLTRPEILGVFVGFILWFFLILFFGEYLWNNVLVKLIPGVKPVTSVWQILGLSILIGILKC